MLLLSTSSCTCQWPEASAPDSSPNEIFSTMPCFYAKGGLCRMIEHAGDGDSVTKLHVDIADACNIVVHQPWRPGDADVRPRCGDALAVAPR